MESITLGFKHCTSSFTDDVSTFDPHEYFKEYPEYELYDQEKEYPKEMFKKNGREYENCLYTVHDNNRKELKFVVTEEHLSDEECKKLIPYCRCQICCMWFFNPAKYLACAHCFGCLRTRSDNQYVINKTREYYEKKKNSWTSSIL